MIHALDHRQRWRRLLSKAEICEYLGGIDERTYDQWRAKGIVPGPVPGTNRFDLRAHDVVLDRVQKLQDQPAQRSALDEWRAAHAR